MTVDPLAESYEEWSPFNYVQNNPIRMIDPDGMGHFDTNGNWVADPTDDDTYSYLAQVTQRGQTFTWMGSGTGWVAEDQLSDSQLETMYWNYSDAGQDPFQGAYGNQIRTWSQSWAGFQSGYRKNAKQLTFAKYTLYAVSLILGPGAGASSTSVALRTVEETAPIELNAGIKITSKGLTHTLERHTINTIAKWLSKSKFTDASEVEGLIKEATQHVVTQQANGNFVRIVDAGRIIGIDRATGQATSTYTVVTNALNELVTAFPGRP